MERIILAGRPDVEVLLRRSRRTRRISLRVSGLDGRVTLTMPPRARIREAEAFLREKEGWIRANMARAPGAVRPEIGGSILWEGRETEIREGSGRTARLVDGAIRVPPDPARVQARIAALMKAAARERLMAASGKYAAMLGARFGRISLRDPRSRWGSCSSEGNLMYSWRLIMAPPSVLDYVAAHEVAHLREMNHSRAFWQIMAQICPSHATHRAWLRENGALLHRYRFRD